MHGQVQNIGDVRCQCCIYRCRLACHGRLLAEPVGPQQTGDQPRVEAAGQVDTERFTGQRSLEVRGIGVEHGGKWPAEIRCRKPLPLDIDGVCSLDLAKAQDRLSRDPANPGQQRSRRIDTAVKQELDQGTCAQGGRAGAARCRKSRRSWYRHDRRCRRNSIETRIVDSDLPRGFTAVPHEQAEHPFQPMTQSRQWQCMQLLRKNIDRI